MRVASRTLAAVLGVTFSVAVAFAQRDEFELELELDTQELEALPEPPAAVTAGVTRLTFGVAPVSTDGLLTNQLRNSIRALLSSRNRARFVHLRAFVAGSGDSRRVQEVVSEVFQNRHRPLPSLSVIQVGALPYDGAQLVLEYVTEERREQNPYGIALVSSGAVEASSQTLESAPLVEKALERIRSEFASLGRDPPEVLRATCYCSTLADGTEVRRAMLAAFPGADVNPVEMRRGYARGSATCEAVVRLAGPAHPLKSPRGAVLGPGPATFTGAQLGFRTEDSDIRLAFERLGRVLEESGTSLDQVVKWNIFPLSLALAERVHDLGLELLDRSEPPVTVLVETEGLPSLDASFAVDMVAVN